MDGRHVLENDSKGHVNLSHLWTHLSSTFLLYSWDVTARQRLVSVAAVNPRGERKAVVEGDRLLDIESLTKVSILWKQSIM